MPETPEDDSIEKMKNSYRSGLVLDLRTGHWGMDNHRAKYYARARIINLDNSEVLWDRHCRWVVVDRAAPSPKKEALYADDGALLKANLQRAAETCADELALMLVNPSQTRMAVAAAAKAVAAAALRSAQLAKPPAEMAKADAPGVAAHAGTSDPRFPTVGDRWEYSYVDTTSGRKRRAQVEIGGVSGARVEEWLTIDGANAEPHRHGQAPVLAFNRLWLEFSPYLLSFAEAHAGATWKPLAAGKVPVCARPGVTCELEGRIAGIERVATPGGDFDTVKVVLDFSSQDINRSGTGFTAKRQMTYWYSAQAKRMVKMTARTLRGNTNDADYDLELISYSLR
jgi:hypothetical protein